MATVNFGEGDAWLLWTIPQGGCDLEHILDVFVFVARAAVPTFGRVRDCLSRGVRAGILLPPSGGRYELASAWEKRFRQIVEEHSPTELGLIELDDFLAAGNWPEVSSDFSLAEDEYRRAAERVEQHYASLHGRRV